MSHQIRIGIVGYGNLGRGAEFAVQNAEDMELVAVFSRRKLAHPLGQPLKEIEQWRGKVDVLVLCGGSATDLPEQGPLLGQWFHTVDSFDTHARIPEYFEKMDAISRRCDTVSVISTGWDPGLFSLMRVLGDSVLPKGKSYTFWGRGVSQGHSDAIRRIAGVKDARQYTVPSEDAMNRVRSGENPELSTREKHTRECYVVLEEGADADRIQHEIQEMPNYFSDYDTKVTFITQQEMVRDHAELPHGGRVFHSGLTGEGQHQGIDFGLKLDSNPEFTASVLIAYARAAHRLAALRDYGAHTVLDIPLGLLSPRTADELRRNMV